MTYFIFTLWFLLAAAIVIGVRFFIRKFQPKWWYDLILFVSELILAIVIAFLSMATDISITRFGSFLFAMYIALFGDSFAHLVFIFIDLFGKKIKRFFLLTIISNFLAVSFMVFGMVNMSIVTPKYLQYSSSKLTNSYKVAFVSDLHVGMAQTIERSIQTIRDIKQQQPDFTIIGGDLADEYTTMEDMKTVVKEFKDFTTPVYFIHGNHELFSHVTITDLEEELESNGVEIIIDEFVKLSSDLTLLGREDLLSPNRKTKEELVNPYPSTYLLCADHQPRDFENNCSIGVDLQLSGHTHAGQLFPNQMIYNLGTYSYGEYRYNQSFMHVSSGASGWQNPIRTEVGCQFEVITLSPAN